MSETWNAINKLETLTYKVSNAADVLELIAVECTEDPHSGAIWHMRDSLKALANEFEREVEALYRNHLAELNDDKPRSEKKKK
jgi:hypothetical protein